MTADSSGVSRLLAARIATWQGEKPAGAQFGLQAAGALAEALKRLIENEALKIEMGKAARERAVSEFSSETVNAEVLFEYARLSP